jgi:hypothetical protein
MAVGTEKRVIRTNMVREQNHVASRKIKRKEHTVKELVLYSKSTPVTLSVLVKPTKLKGGSDDDTHHSIKVVLAFAREAFDTASEQNIRQRQVSLDETWR